MAGPIGTLASRLAAAFVTLDQGATQDRFQRGKSAHKSVAAFSQRGSGFFLYIHQTTYTTGLIIEQSKKPLSTFFLPSCQVIQKSNQFEKRFCVEPRRW